MRWLASFFFLVLLSSNSFGQADCVEGMVVLRLSPTQTPNAGLVAAAPPSFGIQALDQILSAYAPTLIRPFLASTAGLAQSEEVDQMIRTYVVYYADEANPHDVVADLLEVSNVETAFVNKLVTKYHFGTSRAVPTDLQFTNQSRRTPTR